MLGKKDRKEWITVDSPDTIEIHKGKSCFLLPKSSIEGLVQWMLEGVEASSYDDESLEGVIEKGRISLKDQLFSPISFDLTDVPWFLSLIGVEIEKAEDNEIDEIEEQIEEETDNGLPVETLVDQIEEPVNTQPLEAAADKLSEKIHEIAKSTKTGVIPVKPMILPVYRLAYIDCQCGMTIKMGANSTYNGSAVVCPGCQAIILLLDSEE